MNFFSVITEPAILIITATFVLFMMMVYTNYSSVKKNLSYVQKFLSSIEKKELSYRFNELDAFMRENLFTSIIWEDFRKSLIFPEKMYSMNTSVDISNLKSDIYLTVDASYFFNEETLVFSKINHKLIQTMPTILTGLGPFFTFFKMALAFTVINFTIEESAVNESLSSLMLSIQIAALCSVCAVGFSLLFMSFEKVLYNKMCKKYYLAIQKELIRLFDVVSSENFLVDLLRETKSQTVSTEALFNELPDKFYNVIEKGVTEKTIPYLENILYSLNKINENISKNSGNDVVDKLF